MEAEGTAKQGRRKMAFRPSDVVSIWERDHGLCGICGQSIAPESLSFDYIVPVSRGGDDSLDNVRPAHLACVVDKSDRLVEESTRARRVASASATARILAALDAVQADLAAIRAELTGLREDVQALRALSSQSAEAPAETQAKQIRGMRDALVGQAEVLEELQRALATSAEQTATRDRVLLDEVRGLKEAPAQSKPRRWP